MYRIAASGAGVNLVGRAWICGIAARVIGVENIPPAPASAPHIVMSKHSSTWETLALTLLLPAARLRRQEGAAVDPVLRLGLRAGLADHHRPQGRHRRDAADRHAGPRALPPGLLDRRLPGGHADPRRHARQVQDRRRAARDRARRADRPGRAQRGLPVAEGRLRQASGHGDHVVRPADQPRRQGRASADAEVETLDRGRSRAPRSCRVDGGCRSLRPSDGDLARASSSSPASASTTG